MSLTAKFLFGLALIFLVLSVAVDFLPVREATDLDQFKAYTGTEPWAVSNVRPGERLEKHQSRLGAPERDIDMKPGHVIRWTSPRDITLTVSPIGEITEVLSDSITVLDKPIVSSSMSRAEIERVLGRGQVRTERRPSGSGVITLGYEEVSKTLIYENQGVRFELNLQQDSLRYVRASLVRPSR